MRFGVGRLENPFKEIKELRQIGSIEDYITEFKLFSSQCGGLPKNQFLRYFIGGLRSEKRSRVKTISQRIATSRCSLRKISKMSSLR